MFTVFMVICGLGLNLITFSIRVAYLRGGMRFCFVRGVG